MINKKIIYIVPILLLLFGCRANKEDFYSLSIGDNQIVVGYDENVLDSLEIEYSISNINKKEVVSKIIYYLADSENDAYLNGYKLESIKDTCDYFEGDLTYKNGNTCIFGKKIKSHDNYVILYSDILSDDLDNIDRIEIYYQ